ncbi:MAG: AMP-binding protein [Planctomycetaceae bacterium]|jgi:acyl-[acyl-carrier-protein]-phospholipid O-acyltransferase/long-chain-fatty-acid--[acyl-carrier-protein] ligase|nr:AMP-binding protein [Planctomycetaceae bacterium]
MTMFRSSFPELLIPIRQMLRVCRAGKKELKFADSTGMEMTGGRVLLTALVFRRLFHRNLGANEKNVGLLMPTSVYGVLANLGLALDRRTSVNLNYTFGLDTINYCIRHADIKHVITSRRVLDRFPDLKLDAELIVMEDVGKTVTWIDKLTSFIDAYFTPISFFERVLGLHCVSPDDILTIIYTSGSTGTPKGAMITHRGIAENVWGFFRHLDLKPTDVILGSLPLFHAYGYTTTFWLPSMSTVKGIYHFNPLEYKKVGEMARRYGCSAFPTTPTFLRGYIKRCPKEDFETVNTVICGAEKLPEDLVDAWAAKFGCRPAEGYGTTELSPVVSVNVPEGRRSDYRDWFREGTIGKPLINLQARTVDVETGKPIPDGVPGMLQIKGPSVMAGYYKDEEKTEKVLKDGWYTTGDIASIDEAGFIRITGRLSRISKVGGEMVPHILLEEEIEKILSSAATKSVATKTDSASETEIENNEIRLAVSAIPDERKGERLIVLYRDISVTPEEICKQLQKAGLPNLWIPSPHDFFSVESIPLLGTGKLDLCAVKELAEMATKKETT